MSRWNDQFQNHAFRTSWNSMKALLDDAELEKNNNEPAVKEIARLRKVVKYIDSVMEQIDPELMPISLFDTLNQHATNSISQLNTFKSNQAIGHLHNVNSYIDSIITIFSQTPFMLAGQQKGNLSKAASAYSEVLDRHLDRLNEAVDAEVGGIKKNVETIQISISENEKTLAALKEQLQSVSQTIQKQTAEFNTQFQASEKARVDKYDVALAKLEKRIDDEVVRLGTKADAEFEKLSTKAGTTLEVLGKFHDDAAKVFGVVVNTLQAGAYSSYANEEKKTANILRWSAIALMILGVAVLVIPEIAKFVKEAENYVLDWHVTLGRIPFSIILFVPAFYLARESNKHRNTEVLNRRRELILSTIDPYLALLDDDKAQQIKLEIAKGIFSEGAQSTADSSTEEAGNLIAQIANLIKQARDK
ncbi:hypothetical protein [Sideroxyarcus sp. TK5]